MTINIDGEKYYGTAEICKTAGISRATLFRWLKAGVLPEYRKNRRGWRLFTDKDLEQIRNEVNKIEVEPSPANDILHNPGRTQWQHSAELQIVKYNRKRY
jgi:hypothetical protein